MYLPAHKVYSLIVIVLADAAMKTEFGACLPHQLLRERMCAYFQSVHNPQPKVHMYLEHVLSKCSLFRRTGM